MGFLVITARARPMLKIFGNVSQGKIMLVDAAGYLLYHPELNEKTDWKIKQVEEKIQNYFPRSLSDLLPTNIILIC